MDMAATTAPKQVVLPEPPLEKLRDIATNHASCWCTIRRKNQGGGYTQLGNRRSISAEDVINIETFVRSVGGGGKYRVELLSETDYMSLCEPFMVELDGMPILNGVQRTQLGLVPGVDPRAIVQGHSALFDQTAGDPAHPVSQQGFDPVRYWNQTPDQIATNELERARKDAETERNRREAERLKAEKETDALKAQLAELRTQMVAAEARRETSAIQAQFDALRAELNAARNQAPAKPAIDWVALAPVIGALVPLFTTMINAGKERTNAQVQSQQELLKQLLVNKPEGFNLEKLVALAPVVTPLVKAFLEERSPSKTAEVLATMADQNMAQLSLVSQMLTPVLEQSNDPTAEFIMRAISGIQDVAMKVVASTKAPIKQLANQPAQQLNATNTTASAPAPDPAVEDIIQQIVASQLPPAYKTAEWLDIYRDLFNGVPADTVAKTIADHLNDLHAANTLPPEMRPVFESTDKPSTTLIQLLRSLLPPDNDAYMRAVLAAFDAAFEGDAESEAEVVDNVKAAE